MVAGARSVDVRVLTSQGEQRRLLVDEARAGPAHPAAAALAEVVLRRARLRALRRDHPAARVLPDAQPSARSSTSARDEIAEPTRAPTRSSSSARARRRRRGCCSTRLRAGGHARALRAVRRERADAARAPRAAIAGEYPGIEVHAVVGDFERHLDRSPPAGRAARRVPRRHDRQPRPRDARTRFLGEVARGARARRRAPARHRPREGRGRLVAAYDDAAGVTAEFNRNVLRVLNRELGADFDLDALRARRRAGTPTNEWIEMRLRATQAESVPVQRARRGRRRSPTARRCAPRSARSSASSGSKPSSRPPACSSPRWWTDAGGDFALVLAFGSE